MDDCVIGDNTIVAGGSFLKEGTIIPPNSVVMGTPGKVVRTQNNWVENHLNAELYLRNARAYASANYRAWSGPDFDQWYASRREELRQLQAQGREQESIAEPSAGL